jgi:hypothetical protein
VEKGGYVRAESDETGRERYRVVAQLYRHVSAVHSSAHTIRPTVVNYPKEDTGDRILFLARAAQGSQFALSAPVKTKPERAFRRPEVQLARAL